jgi:hypothetical protein
MHRKNYYYRVCLGERNIVMSPTLSELDTCPILSASDVGSTNSLQVSSLVRLSWQITIAPPIARQEHHGPSRLYLSPCLPFNSLMSACLSTSRCALCTTIKVVSCGPWEAAFLVEISIKPIDNSLLAHIAQSNRRRVAQDPSTPNG